MANLRVPGPTPLPDEVLKALSRQMINHRGQEFKQLLADVTAKLKTLFQTKNDLFLLTGAGTGGLEAAVVNTLSPGDKVLAVVHWRFWRTIRKYCQTVRCRCNHTRLRMGKGG